MTTFQFRYCARNRLDETLPAESWEGMVRMAEERGLSIGKRRTEWDRQKAQNSGIEGKVVSYAVAQTGGQPLSMLVEIGG
jgi:hypothetical protein